MNKEAINFDDLVVRESGESNFRWYLVQTQSNCENKAIENVKVNLSVEKLDSKVKKMVFPAVEITEIRNGKKVKKMQKLYPGYIMIFADMDLDVYSSVTRANKVTKFLNKLETRPLPVPMKDNEVENIINKLSDVRSGSEDLLKIKLGNSVRVLSGTFADFNGEVKDINKEEGMAKVAVTLLGRETIIDMSINDLELVSEKEEE